MARFKVKFGMRDQDEEISQRVSIPQQDIIIGPDKPEEASQQDHHYNSQSNNEICDMDAFTELPAIPSSSHSLASRRKIPTASTNPSAAAHPRMMIMTRTQSRRDIPVMESCKMRTVIEPDKSSSCGSLSRSAPPSQTKTNLNNSSNYKSCTELTTTSIMLLWIMMMTRRISKFWRSFRHPHHHHHPPSHLHSNYNHHHHHRRVNSSCLRTFIVPLVICVLSNNASLLVHGQPPPLPPAGFLDFDNLPVTRFSCEGKVIGGYYADVETGCQMFHVCTLGQKDEIQDIKFLCLNGTVFDQETRVCERVDEVDCSKAEQFFDLNLDLYVPHATTQKPEEADLEEEDDNIRPVQTSARSKQNNNNTPPPPPPPPPPTTRPTTTTTTTTTSPRTRPPSSSLSSRTRSPPIISGPSSHRQSSREQEEDEEEEEEDERNSGNNAYTSFNYYLKTPHSHVQSGYNSQSRQSYLINTAGSNGRGSEGGRGRGQSGPSGSGSTNNPVAATTSTGRKVPSGSGQKTIIYSSTSTSSSSTQRPKTVIVVKSTLPPTKSILKPKTLATPRSTTTTTPIPPTKYELDDQYDEYYDDEDYPLEQQQQPQQQSKSSTSFQQSYSNKPSLTGNYDFRDGRSTKGVANAGQTIHSTTGRSPSTSDRSKSTIVVSRQEIKATPKPILVSPANIKVISSEFIGNNSTEDPYYYEDDYPDDATLQQEQQEQLRQAGYSSTSPSSHGKSVSPSSRGHVVVSSSSKGKSGTLEQSKIKPGSVNVNKQKEPTSSADTSDYYDDDTDNVNPHDHHFTHVDVPRIPFAKPNVPRVLVTNGKPFLPRLRRQSHYNHYFSPAFSPPLQQQREYFIKDHLLLPGAPSRPLQRSTVSLLNHNFQSRAHHPEANHQHHPPQHHQPRDRTDIIRTRTSPTELRREARAKAIDWGRDRSRPFR